MARSQTNFDPLLAHETFLVMSRHERDDLRAKLEHEQATTQMLRKEIRKLQEKDGDSVDEAVANLARARESRIDDLQHNLNAVLEESSLLKRERDQLKTELNGLKGIELPTATPEEVEQ